MFNMTLSGSQSFLDLAREAAEMLRFLVNPSELGLSGVLGAGVPHGGSELAERFMEAVNDISAKLPQRAFTLEEIAKANRVD